MRRAIPHAMVSAGQQSRAYLARLSLETRLGILFGIIMPVVSALMFPTYVQLMPEPWMERARLLELPFVASEILVIGWAYRTGLDRDRIVLALPTDIKVALAVFLLAMFAGSTLVSPFPADAVLQTIIQVIHLYFAMAVFHLAMACKPGTTEQLTKPMGTGLVVLGAYTAGWFGFAPDPATLPGGKVDWNFAVPGFISVRYLGTWCGAIATALAIHLLRTTSPDRSGAYRALYALAAFMAMWSGTRAAILGIGAALFVFVVSTGLPRPRPVATVLLLTMLAVALALLFPFHDPVFQLFAAEDAGSVNRLTSGRSGLWAATVARWLDAPLLGWGTGSTFYVVDVGWTHTQPHNAFLQFLISWGLVGAVACCWLLGRAIRAAHRIAMADRSKWPLLGMIYSLLAMSMVDGALYYPRFIIVIVGGLALIVGRAVALSGQASARMSPCTDWATKETVLAVAEYRTGAGRTRP